MPDTAALEGEPGGNESFPKHFKAELAVELRKSIQNVREEILMVENLVPIS